MAKNQNQALIVFETLNTRGRGLTKLDLVKNLLFIKTDISGWEELRSEWKRFTDVLNKTSMKPTSFLKYFLLSTFGIQKAEDFVYDTIRDEFERLNPNVSDPAMALLAQLHQTALTLEGFRAGRVSTGPKNWVVSNINVYVTSSTQHLPVMLAVSKLPQDSQAKFFRAVESLLVALGVLKMYTGETEKIFNEWTLGIRELKDSSGKDIESFYQSEVAKKVKYFGSLAMDRLRSADSAALSSKKTNYLLRRAEVYLQDIAGVPGLDVEDAVPLRKVDIEHILPQDATYQWSSLGFDSVEQLDDYLHRIGNLTILEKPLNRSIKNKAFAEKKTQGYKPSDFLLTSAIADQFIGNHQKARASNLVLKFMTQDTFGKAEIIARQENLVEILGATFEWK